MVDKHEIEMKAMAAFKRGDIAEGRRLQDEFLATIKSSGEDYCNCPAACKFHGKCMECVTLHRGHADHLPHCLKAMVNERLDSLSALTEHSIKGVKKK